ncbi:DUF4124 domain-containing protein [Chitinibacter bivalviorum]|uniref:DUF4124 domain-containing protein n=1 Tax=Chitinibacter bivalviorum TaxID=2739434 RepID=A0A7H9BFH7_9NEIS|nr:DUF4124 domain-containing protein [Chitinibacter bivalviorum]QLG87460.1 DUF4124 domain-containing protein [Chitinibacter bivalviorum]
MSNLVGQIMRNISLFIVAMTAVAFSLSAQAQVYKWVDSTGRVVYSDQPPPAGSGKAKTVNVKDTAVTSVASPKKQEASTASAVAVKPASAVATAKPPRDEAACAAAEKRLSFLVNAKLYKEFPNDKGQVEFLPEDKKKQEIAEKKAYIEKSCK